MLLQLDSHLKPSVSFLIQPETLSNSFYFLAISVMLKQIYSTSDAKTLVKKHMHRMVNVAIVPLALRCGEIIQTAF